MCFNQPQSGQSHISITFPVIITVHLTKTLSVLSLHRLDKELVETRACVITGDGEQNVFVDVAFFPTTSLINIS